MTKDQFYKIIESFSSIQDLSSAATAYFKNKEGCHIESVNLTGIDLDAAKHIVEKVDDLTDRFNTTLRNIETESLSECVGGRSMPDADRFMKCLREKTSEYLEIDMQLNKKFLSSKKVIEDDYKDNMLTHQNVIVKRDLADVSTLVHEFGHTILPGKASEHLNGEGVTNPVYLACRRLFRQYVAQVRSLRREIQDIQGSFAGQKDGLAKGYKASEKKRKELDDFLVSKYSMDSPGEFIAECFVDAECSEKPKAISLKVYEALMKGYGKI